MRDCCNVVSLKDNDTKIFAVASFMMDNGIEAKTDRLTVELETPIADLLLGKACVATDMPALLD